MVACALAVWCECVGLKGLPWGCGTVVLMCAVLLSCLECTVYITGIEASACTSGRRESILHRFVGLSLNPTLIAQSQSFTVPCDICVSDIYFFFRASQPATLCRLLVSLARGGSIVAACGLPTEALASKPHQLVGLCRKGTGESLELSTGSWLGMSMLQIRPLPLRVMQPG